MITPEDIREAREGLEALRIGLNDKIVFGPGCFEALKTALEALDEVERLQAENTKLKNHLDIAYGEAGGGDGRG